MDFVSIVLINYNNFQDTIECLESVFKIDYPNYQIIVVDNQSLNNSWGQLKNWLTGKITLDFSRSPFSGLVHPPIVKPVLFCCYQSQGNGSFIEEATGIAANDLVMKADPSVKALNPVILIRSHCNLGFSGGNNLAVRFALAHSNPAFFWFLNNDTVVERGALSALVSTHGSNPRCGAVGSKIYLYHDSERLQDLGGGEIAFGHSHHPFYRQKDQDFPSGIMNGYIGGCSFLISRKTLEKVGEWDETYFLYGEDLDLSVRIKKAGYELFFCNQSKIWHKEGCSGVGAILEPGFPQGVKYGLEQKHIHLATYYGFRNWVYFMSKYEVGFLRRCFYFLIYLPLYALQLVYHYFFYEGRNSGKIRAVLFGFIDSLFGRMGKRRCRV